MVTPTISISDISDNQLILEMMGAPDWGPVPLSTEAVVENRVRTWMARNMTPPLRRQLEIVEINRPESAFGRADITVILEKQ